MGWGQPLGPPPGKLQVGFPASGTPIEDDRPLPRPNIPHLGITAPNGPTTAQMEHIHRMLTEADIPNSDHEGFAVPLVNRIMLLCQRYESATLEVQNHQSTSDYDMGKIHGEANVRRLEGEIVEESYMRGVKKTYEVIGLFMVELERKLRPVQMLDQTQPDTENGDKS